MLLFIGGINLQIVLILLMADFCEFQRYQAALTPSNPSSWQGMTPGLK